MTDLAWMEDALCATVSPEFFFTDDVNGGNTNQARKLCAACDVREQCLAWSLTQEDQPGIFAGTTRKQRARLRMEAAA